MFSAHGAAELDDQVRDLAGDRAKRLHAGGGLDVNDRSYVQAPDVGVAIAGGRHSVLQDDESKALVELGQPGWIDGRVLDECDRLGIADHAHQEREPRLAYFPEI